MNRFTLDDVRGVIPAIMTPFTKEGALDRAAVREMVDLQISLGAGGFYLTGTGGQGPYMEAKQRMEVVEAFAEATDGRVPLIPHIAFVSPAISAEMAKHAASVGCTAVSGVPSYYYQLSRAEMYAYYEELAGATDLPFLVYALNGKITPTVELFQKLAEIPNVKGLKFTGADHYMMGRIKEHLGPDFKVYSGKDEQFLSAILCNVDGLIGGTYNVFPDLYIRAVDELKRGDFATAQKDMLAANAILEVMLKYGSAEAKRACLGFMGINAGYNPRPVHTLDADEAAALKRDLIALRDRLEIEPIALFRAI